ncbi:MAG TPA: dienelactone hydrolase family protein [Candidatus Limnocylindrales bacterium]|jgi:dienelactone hydrolase
MSLPRASSLLALAVILAACGGTTTSTSLPVITPGATAVPATQAPQATAPPVATPASTAAPAPAINGERVSFKNGELTLGGLLWKPEGNGPFRTVVWNHGSEQLPGSPQGNPLVGTALVAQGYVVFVPFRRGQGTSQGTWIDTALKAVPVAERPALLAKLHTTEQLSDQLAGLAYIKSQAYVDPTKIAVAGWSFGGIQTVLGAGDASAGYVAAVAFTPASQSWDGNPDLQAALLTAAKAATVPFLFIQAENDYSLVPTQELTDAIVADEGTASRSIYPAFGSTAQDGHEFAVRGTDQWIPEVVTFLNAAFGA